ncbi:MAG TPA: hypothetical protein VFS40_02215 [Gemmatimonadales bacterium]|nr:hypothetical protein [Gemmatimonadales bacterium]
MNRSALRSLRPGFAPAALATLALAACGGERATPTRAATADSARTDSAAAPAAATAGRAAGDSLAAERDGMQIWFTLARPATDSAGRRCLERGIELRDTRAGGRRTPVPLFYTTETPRFVNDTVAEAHLSNGCRPGPLYGIDLRTGQPIPPSQMQHLRAR